MNSELVLKQFTEPELVKYQKIKDCFKGLQKCLIYSDFYFELLKYKFFYGGERLIINFIET